jgi:hypothetical protein
LKGAVKEEYLLSPRRLSRERELGINWPTDDGTQGEVSPKEGIPGEELLSAGGLGG